MKHALRFSSRCGALLVAALPVLAVEETERAWSDQAELVLVATAGNSETENLALRNEYTYNWDKASLELKAGALRTNTTTRAVSNEASGLLVSEVSETTAERYFVDGVYRHKISEALYWYGGAGWERNRFAGIDSRTSIFGGVGFVVFDTELQSFQIETGLDYTEEEQISGKDLSYAGARAFFDYHHKLSESAEFNTSLEILESLEDTEDLRATWIGAITATLTSRLALKASYTVFFDNQPVQELVAGDPLALPTPIPDRVFEFDNVDTIFAASLVVNF